jgi:hypothetical protein
VNQFLSQILVVKVAKVYVTDLLTDILALLLRQMEDFVGVLLAIAEEGGNDARVEAKHLSYGWRSEVKKMLPNATYFLLKDRNRVLEQTMNSAAAEFDRSEELGPT